MAVTELAVQRPVSGGLEATYSAATVDGFALDNRDGDVILHVVNGNASDCTVSIDTPGTVDGLAIPAKTIVVTAGEERFIGPFLKKYYNQDNSAVSGVKQAVIVTFSIQASVTAACLKVTPVTE
jgi:hypothetical protein